ncbi:MAG: hypothetical protein ABIG29_00935 [Candidatus Nealsonbacteria bacterium]
MTRNRKILIIIIAAITVILMWAPWLDNQSLHDKVFEERAEIDGTIDKYTGELVCDYNVMWAPFGRWVASCEGGYYVTFWGKILYPGNHNIELPENNFDAAYQIPGTNIFFRYPSDGFYGLGINIASSTEVRGLISGMHAEPVSEFERDAQSAYVVLNINLIENEKAFTNINNFAEDFKKDSDVSFYDREYAKENGRIAEINDKEYFIYKVTEDATAWSAYTINKNGIVWVMLAYTNSLTPYSDSAYKNNDGLFLEILENISFEEIPVFADDEPEIVVSSLLQTLNDSSLGVKFSDLVKSSQWWISEDDWSINVPNAISIVSKDIRGSSVEPLDAEARNLNYFISNIFLVNDFELNATNTSKSEREPEFFDYIVAFQKGETQCTLTTNGESWEYTVTCSDGLQKAYEAQIPYLKALDRRDVIVNVRKKIGDFAWLDVHPRRTGNLALMKDEGGEMRLIFSGQEAPPCDLMIENGVPEEVYGTCNNVWRSIQNNNNDQE